MLIKSQINLFKFKKFVSVIFAYENIYWALRTKWHQHIIEMAGTNTNKLADRRIQTTPQFVYVICEKSSEFIYFITFILCTTYRKYSKLYSNTCNILYTST